VLVSGMLCAGAPGTVMGAPVSPPRPAPADLPAVPGVPGAARALSGLAPLPAPAPSRTAGPLAAEVTRLAALVGVRLHADSVRAEVRRARLHPDTAMSLSRLVVRMRACTAVTRAALERTPHRALATGTAQMPAGARTALRECAVALRWSAGRAERVLSTAPAGQRRLVLWPVLAYSPDPERDDRYVEDYMLQVDRGGDDRYYNNQGSNQVDLKRSVSSAAARYHRPSRGCMATFPDSTSGRVVRGPHGERRNSLDGQECTPTTALLLDLGGNDRYGRMQPPVFPDTECSTDPSVRRMSTIGVGVEGVGMLIDDAGDDRYLGRSVTMGAGHLGGVGLLEDRRGDDTYLAMRNAQGLGLLGGLGVLRDRHGDDTYDFHMPDPIDPQAPNQTEGAGGVVDDSGLGSEAGLGPHNPDGIGGRCDRIMRSLQGVGVMGPAAGILVDSHGDDRYRAPGYRNQDGGFPIGHLVGSQLVRLAHGSQGSGFFGGVGVLVDRAAGDDAYVRRDGSPAPNRRNDMVDGPKADPTSNEDGSPDNGKPVDLSLFYDAE
jgi:hypothetical protein